MLVGCRPALGHSQGDSLTNPILIAAFQPKGQGESRKEDWYLSLNKQQFVLLLFKQYILVSANMKIEHETTFETS